MKITTVVLAAGRGTRMQSNLPKVLHEVANMSLLEYVLQVATNIAPAAQQDIRVVTSNELESHKMFQALATRYQFHSCIQRERLGTANALKSAIDGDGSISSDAVLVLYGDIPFISANTLKMLIDVLSSSKAAIVGAGFFTEDPHGYGRLICGEGQLLLDIVEEKDATDGLRKITLCNAGVMLIRRVELDLLLAQIDNNNVAKEYYLTDIIKIANHNRLQCSYIICDKEEALGVNDLLQLAQLEEITQKKLRQKFLAAGVALVAPDTIFFSADTIIKASAKIYPYVFIGRKVVIGEGSSILSFTHLESTTISKNCTIGPYARLRPGTVLEDDVKIGNFVELKEANIQKGSKASHLSYIGNVIMGTHCNIGAGAIFCNYDGKHKHSSNVGDNVSIGANSSIVSPVEIGDNTVIGAGSVITEDIEANSLAIARSRQVTLKGRGKR